MDNATSPRMFALTLALLMTLTALASPIGAQQFVELGRIVDSTAGSASFPFTVADIDNDGVQDLVFLGASGSGNLLVAGKQAGGSIGFKQSLLVPDQFPMVCVLSHTASGAPHILTVASNGKVRDFSGWPLRELRTFDVIESAISARIGDVDADGSDDLVVLRTSGYFIYSLADGNLIRSVSAPGFRDFALAQLDPDPALEIILAGPVAGLVLDGATNATDWSYPNGFGWQVATGLLGSDGTAHWVASQGWGTFTVFRSSPWSVAWTGITPSGISAVATASVDTSGNDVALIGDAGWGKVRAYDSVTQQQRFEIPNQGDGVHAITALDIDGDAITDIVFAPISRSRTDPLITIASSQSGVVHWQYFPSDGPKMVTALGDVDGDGDIELVAASTPHFSSHGIIVVSDFETGAVEWSSPSNIGNSNAPFYLTASRIELIPNQGRPGMSIVVAGATDRDGRIIVVDGLTKQVQWHIGQSGSGPLHGRPIKGMRLYDYNSDGIRDFVVATQAETSDTQGALIHVFSGVDGTPLWTSTPMGQWFAPINDVILIEAAAKTRLVAVLPRSLQAFDAQSGLPDWTLAANNDGAVVLVNDGHSEEIAVFASAGAVTVYSAIDQSFHRSFLLSAPLTSLTALAGDVRSLIAKSGNALSLVDGASGAIRATSAYLGRFPEPSAPPALLRAGENHWSAAVGSHDALFRLRLEHPDRIFEDSFEELSH